MAAGALMGTGALFPNVILPDGRAVTRAARRRPAAPPSAAAPAHA